MQKRGLSGIVITVILIAISLSLIAIIWTIIANLVETNLEEAETGLTKITLNIIDGSEKNTTPYDFSIKVDRSYDQNKLTKIKFLIAIENGEIIVIIKPNELNPGAGKTFKFNTNEIDGASDVLDLIEISVAPIVEMNGKEQTLAIADIHKFEF